VAGQGVLQSRYGGAQPARDTDADGVGRDRLEALQLDRAGEERGAVLLFPQVVGLTLVRVLQEVQVGRDDGDCRGLRLGVELGVQLEDGQGLVGWAVGLVGPVPWRSVDEE
jgi:hypothetical protein